jgi:nucleotide-binding universal stress UspA family protein
LTIHLWTDDVNMSTWVIVGYDGSKSSASALAWATVEAVARNAPLHIVTCYDLPIFGALSFGLAKTEVYTKLLDDAHNCAASARDQIGSEYPELLISTTVSAGPASLELLDVAGMQDIIVVGASEHHGATAALLRSTPRRVAHHAHCPVVIVRGEDDVARAPTRVVVGVDGSNDATNALQWAVGEADRFGVELVIVHAWSYAYIVADAASAQARDTTRIDAACVLERMVELAREAIQGPITDVLIENPTVAGLIDQVREGDLLVLGSRGRGAVRSALFGSTVNSMLDHSPVTVVVIPHTGNES